jgi:SAM-dependent methyltransferase
MVPVAGRFPDHFSGNAAAYANYRPAYPDAFVAEIAALAPGRSLAWDCATGSGQAALLLAEHFDRVIATDASAEQIRNAIVHPRVHYHVAHEDGSLAQDRTVQLVTVATALHWLDLPRFYAEVRRVLVPGGVLAAWGYGYPSINADIDAVIMWFGKERVAQHWPPERYHLETGYRELAFPFHEIAFGERSMTVALSREQFAGYVATWSSVARARRAETVDPMSEFLERLSAHWGDQDVRQVTWPLYTKIGRMPA